MLFSATLAPTSLFLSLSLSPKKHTFFDFSWIVLLPSSQSPWRPKERRRREKKRERLLSRFFFFQNYILETSVATVRPSRCAVLSAALHRPRSLPSGAWQMHRAPWRPPSRLGPAASSPPCYATSAQRWVANAGQADGKTVTSGPGSRPINAATRTPFECARPNHPKRPRSLVSGSPPINYASASGCLRERQLWHRPHRCESTVPTRRAHLSLLRVLDTPSTSTPQGTASHTDLSPHALLTLVADRA